MKLEILCGWALTYKTIAKSIAHSIKTVKCESIEVLNYKYPSVRILFEIIVKHVHMSEKA